MPFALQLSSLPFDCGLFYSTCSGQGDVSKCAASREVKKEKCTSACPVHDTAALSCILTISMRISAHQPGGRWESMGSRAASSRLKLPEASQFKAYPEAYYTGVSTLSQTRPVQSRAAGTPSWPNTWQKNNGCDFKSRNFGVMCHGAVSMYYNFLPLAKVFSLHDFKNFFLNFVLFS